MAPSSERCAESGQIVMMTAPTMGHGRYAAASRQPWTYSTLKEMASLALFGPCRGACMDVVERRQSSWAVVEDMTTTGLPDARCTTVCRQCIACVLLKKEWKIVTIKTDLSSFSALKFPKFLSLLINRHSISSNQQKAEMQNRLYLPNSYQDWKRIVLAPTRVSRRFMSLGSL